MASLPYVTAPGNVTKALNAIASASTPQKITQDFVKEILKIPGGSGDQMTSYLKKIGMAGPDGTPTKVYSQFRNEATRGAAAAAALRFGYGPLYKRNEYMHELSDVKLKGLIIEETGASDESTSVGSIANCIRHLKSFAEFGIDVEKDAGVQDPNVVKDVAPEAYKVAQKPQGSGGPKGMGMNLSYTINLNLPATSDIAVFNAIFKSLKENLLSSIDE